MNPPAWLIVGLAALTWLLVAFALACAIGAWLRRLDRQDGEGE